MNESKIAVRYAKALFDLAIEKNVTDKMYSDIHLILNTIEQSLEFKEVLGNPVIRASNKLKFLKAVFEGKIEIQTSMLFNLLLKNKRESYLSSICRVFIQLYKQHKNIISVNLITAKPIEKSLESKILELVKKIYKSDIEIIENIDESLIGGFILRIDDRQFDASISTKLKNYKESLLNTSIESKK